MVNLSIAEKIDQAVDNLDIIKCPHCEKSITWLPNEPAECQYCGWKQEPSIDGPNLQFGNRYSELARMRPWRAFPGINAAQVGSGVAD